MGADELQMMVHNNVYTNVLAKKAFEYTLCVLDEMKVSAQPELELVGKKVGLGAHEPNDWRVMAEKMIILYDEKSGIYEQHDGFFDMPHIEVGSIPENQFPVEDHWAYDRTFRYDMLNQPDVLLLMFLYNSDYSKTVKLTNYEYYEPRCSHESPFSPAIHSILATELGLNEKADAYENFPVRVNMEAGSPIGAMASNWLNIVYGYGGLRADGEKLVLNPVIPKDFASYSFSVVYRNVWIIVDVGRESVSLKTNGGSANVVVYGKEYRINQSILTL